MDKRPGKPCDKPMQSNFAALQNRIAFTDNGHVALVEIAKRLEAVFSRYLPGNQFSDVTPLLHRYLGNARQGLPVLIKRGGIANHKNFRMLRNPEIFLNSDSASPIYRSG